MSQEDFDAIPNAAAIIERFGGIRPMAAKVGAPVTTVQGWKKRDVIPGARREDILKAAADNGITITDLMSGAQANAVGPETAPFQKTESSAFIESSATSEEEIKITVEPLRKAPPQPLPPRYTAMDTTHEELMSAIAKGQKKAVSASAWTALGICAVLAGAGAFLLTPGAKKLEQHEDQIAALEGKMGAVGEDVQEMNTIAGSLKDMMPEEMRRTVAELKTEADAIRADVEKVAQDAQNISNSVLAADAGTLSDRLSVLEAKFGDMEGGQALKDLTARIRNLEVSIAGQDQIAASVAELSQIVDSLDGQVNMLGTKMAETKERPESALGETLEGVSGNDMKAAALLIAFSQLRDSLNRNAPFEDDLVLLQKLVGSDDPALQEALARLAPQAEKGGVLTSQGLSEELQTMTGDIVFASLKGEDVSIADQAKVRLAQVLNVKKDGELVGGTPTQKTVAKAQEQLGGNDIAGALATLQTLEGDARTKANPIIEQAEAALLADQVQNMLRQMIVANVGTDMNTAAGAIDLQDVTTTIQNAVPGQQNVIRDEDSGFTILPSAPKGFKGLSAE
jgi:uncharacterized coiled-coil protein SlyX